MARHDNQRQLVPYGMEFEQDQKHERIKIEKIELSVISWRVAIVLQGRLHEIDSGGWFEKRLD